MLDWIRYRLTYQYLVHWRPWYNAWRRAMIQRKTFISPTNPPRTPHGIAQHLTGRFRWVSDGPFGIDDFSNWPENAYSEGGDCDEAAAVFTLLMRRWVPSDDYRNLSQLAIACPGSGHMVAHWEDDAGQYLASNFRDAGQDSVGVMGPYPRGRDGLMTACTDLMGARPYLVVAYDDDLRVLRVI